mgnify:CR=1 FL=1
MARKRTVDDRVRLDEMKALNREQLADYLSIGTQNATKLAEEAGAIIRVGKRVLFNRSLIDEYIDEISE